MEFEWHSMNHLECWDNLKENIFPSNLIIKTKISTAQQHANTVFSENENTFCRKFCWRKLWPAHAIYVLCYLWHFSGKLIHYKCVIISKLCYKAFENIVFHSDILIYFSYGLCAKVVGLWCYLYLVYKENSTLIRFVTKNSV